VCQLVKIVENNSSNTQEDNERGAPSCET